MAEAQWVPPEDMPPHLREFQSVLGELNKESARGVVLIATSYIDDLLLRTIKAFLVDGAATAKLLTGFNAPLGTMAARSAMAAALGLLHDDEVHDIERLRKVRNRFAHHVHMSFEDQSVSDLCGQLRLSAKDYPGVGVDARGQFLTAAASVTLNLYNRPHYVGLERLQARSWRR